MNGENRGWKKTTHGVIRACYEQKGVKERTKTLREDDPPTYLTGGRAGGGRSCRRRSGRGCRRRTAARSAPRRPRSARRRRRRTRQISTPTSRRRASPSARPSPSPPWQSFCAADAARCSQPLASVSSSLSLSLPSSLVHRRVGGGFRSGVPKPRRVSCPGLLLWLTLLACFIRGLAILAGVRGRRKGNSRYYAAACVMRGRWSRLFRRTHST